MTCVVCGLPVGHDVAFRAQVDEEGVLRLAPVHPDHSDHPDHPDHPVTIGDAA